MTPIRGMLGIGLLMTWSVSAHAQESLDDQIYRVEQLITANNCGDADPITKELIASHPEHADVYRLRAEVGNCLGAPADRVYVYYNRYLAAGGAKTKVASAMAALDQELGTVELQLLSPPADQGFDWSQVNEVSAVPVIIPGRENIKEQPLRPTSPGTYEVSGLVPGRYQIQIAASSGLQPVNLKFNAEAGSVARPSVKLKTWVPSLRTLISEGRCNDAISQATDILNADNTLNAVRLEWLQAAACQERNGNRVADGTLNSNLDAYLQQGGSASSSPYAWAQIKVLPESVQVERIQIFPPEADDGTQPLSQTSGNLARIPLVPGSYRIDLDVNDAVYQDTQQLVELGRTAETVIELSGGEAGEVQIGPRSMGLGLSIRAVTGHVTEIPPDASKPTIAMSIGAAVVTAQFEDETIEYAAEIGPGITELSMPNGILVTAPGFKQMTWLPPENGGLSPAPESITVPIPESEPLLTFQVSTAVDWAPGTIRNLVIDANHFDAVSDYEAWKDATATLKKRRKRNALLFTAGLGTAGAGGFLYLQGEQFAADARSITDPSQGELYFESVNKSDRSYLGSHISFATAGTAVTGALVGLVFSRMAAKQKKRAKLKFDQTASNPAQID